MKSKMKVLVACEYSGVVRDAFIRKGHDATSCDILPSESDGSHYQGNVSDIIGDDWDMLIAHPPCTYLTLASVWALKDPDYDKYPGVGYHQKVKASTLTGRMRRLALEQAINFVRMLMLSGIDRIAIENPMSMISTRIRKPDQVIHPYMFGHDASKSTCLWLKNLPKLVPTKMIEPAYYVCCGKRIGLYQPCPHCNGSKKKLPRWSNQTPRGQDKTCPSDTRSKDRSKTYQGIADAMAEQWG